MPPRETTSTSGGRSSAFTSGTGTDELTVKDVAIDLAKAAPGAARDAILREAALSNEMQSRRAGGHIVNFASDIAQGVANVGINAVNATSRELSSHIGDGRPSAVIPNVRTPKLNVSSTGKFSVAGGSLDRNTKVGTAKSLGFYVEGAPEETVSRTIEGVGLVPFLKPIKAAKAATRAVTNEVDTAARSTAGYMKPKGVPVAPTSTVIRDTAQETVRESRRAFPNNTPAPRSNQFKEPDNNVVNLFDRGSERRSGPSEYETQGPLALQREVSPTEVPTSAPDATPRLTEVPHSAITPEGKSKNRIVTSAAIGSATSPATDAAADAAEKAKDEAGKTTKPTRPRDLGVGLGNPGRQDVHLRKIF
jgi:hypothetical protein